jgi:hypothetical protein
MTILSAAPSSGDVGGNTSVVITGTGFSDVTGVTFCGISAASFVVDSTTQITAVTRSGTIGTGDIVVAGTYTSATLSNGFTYSSSASGSILFSNAGTGSYLQVPNDADFQFGTGDFTVEWFQYQLTSTGVARIVAMASQFQIQITSGGNVNMVVTGGTVFSSPAISGYLNTWKHFAFVRQSNTVTLYVDGVAITSGPVTNNILPTANFRMGNTLTPSSANAFDGYITNFNWIKGTAKYTAAFTPPSAQIVPSANTKFFLPVTSSGTAYDDASGLNKTVTPTDTTYSANTPFPFSV